MRAGLTLCWRGCIPTWFGRTGQWAIFDPQVEPVKIEQYPDGRWVVEVHQVVRDLAGRLLSDVMVRHIYQIRDGLVQRMDIE